MQRLGTTATLLTGICAFWGLSSVAVGNEQPNVVFIVVDDLGWKDLSCQGSDYFSTPNIDRLAENGTRFTNAYAACAVCSPTRAAIITGQSPARIGITDWIRARHQRSEQGAVTENPTGYVAKPTRKLQCPPNAFFLPKSHQTIAERLKSTGYKTCFVGKWHLGDPGWYPTDQGFDINVGGCDLGQPPSYVDPYKNPRSSFGETLKPRRDCEFLTSREADEARRFIFKNQVDPFFLYYCPYAVHKATETAASKGKDFATCSAVIDNLDTAVGMIIDALEANRLMEDTLIIVTSDNGGLRGRTNNDPLRQGKGYAYEGGIRVPAIVSWRGTLPAGIVSDQPITSVDYLPTICEATGTAIEDDVNIDGVSLWSHLQSSGKEKLQRDALFWHFPHYRHSPGPYSIIREGDWKLIRWYEGSTELYNLASDISEQNDLFSEMPEKAAELNEKLTVELKRVDAKLPRQNPDFVPKKR